MMDAADDRVQRRFQHRIDYCRLHGAGADRRGPQQASCRCCCLQTSLCVWISLSTRKWLASYHRCLQQIRGTVISAIKQPEASSPRWLNLRCFTPLQNAIKSERYSPGWSSRNIVYIWTTLVNTLINCIADYTCSQRLLYPRPLIAVFNK